MVKLPGWEARLISFVGSVARASFQPGVLDCALFFADGVQVMTGEDIAKPFRGKYKTLATGYRMLRKRGFNDHIEYVASIMPELPSPLSAQRGDCAVALDMDGAPALGIVQGEKVYFMTLNGLTLIPLTDTIRAFRV